MASKNHSGIPTGISPISRVGNFSEIIELISKTNQGCTSKRNPKIITSDGIQKI